MRIVEGFDCKFDGPIDMRFSVKNLQALENLRKSVFSYPFMIVINEADGFSYQLNRSKSKWDLYTARGPKGETGDSAYQEAVNNGFEGTEAEWIESLKGPKGDKGDPLEVGNVRLEEGQLNLEISKNEEGKLDFTLTLPKMYTTEDIGDLTLLKTEDKTIVGAINEIYSLINKEEEVK